MGSVNEHGEGGWLSSLGQTQRCRVSLGELADKYWSEYVYKVDEGGVITMIVPPSVCLRSSALKSHGVSG